MSVQAAIKHLSSHDEILGGIIQAVHDKPSFEPHNNYYQELVDSIISQQLSVKAATTIQRRFNELFGDSDAIPSPKQILTADIEQLRSVGLSRQKATYIRDLAEKVIGGTVRFDHLDSLSNDQVIAELTSIKGVGIWTVHMFLMFSLGRLDVLPVGDLGIRNGVGKLYGLGRAATPDEVASIASQNNWQPYQSVASWYIWRSLDNAPK